MAAAQAQVATVAGASCTAAAVAAAAAGAAAQDLGGKHEEAGAEDILPAAAEVPKGYIAAAAEEGYEGCEEGPQEGCEEGPQAPQLTQLTADSDFTCKQLHCGFERPQAQQLTQLTADFTCKQLHCGFEQCSQLVEQVVWQVVDEGEGFDSGFDDNEGQDKSGFRES